MWDYVPHDFLFCRRRGQAADVGSNQSGWDRVDLSPRDHQLMHVRITYLKWRDRRDRRWPRGDGKIIRSRDRDLTWSIGSSSRSNNRTALETPGRTRSRRDRAAIEPRSRHDRAAIEAEMKWKWSGISPHRSAIYRRSLSGKIDARSRPNRGAIVAKIVEKIVAHVERNWSRNQANSSRIWSHNPRPKNRLHEAWKPLPRMLQLTTIFEPIPSLKTHVLLLCSSTFDRLVKKLSEFRGRS